MCKHFTTIDQAIQRLRDVSVTLKAYDAPFCSDEYNQLANWLNELKRMQIEVDGMRSNWYKSVEALKAARAERDAAVSDLQKVIPSYKYDNHIKQTTVPTGNCVEFG